MKVLHICQSFSNLTETFIYDYIIELERQWTDNHVLTFMRLNESDRPFEKVSTVELKRDFFWFISKLLSILDDSVGLIRERRKIKKAIENIRPDIIHAHFGPMGVLVAPVAKRLKIPLIVSFHGYDASTLLKESYWIKQYKLLNEYVKYVTIVAKDFSNRLTMFDKDKLKVVHVGKRLEDYPFNPKPNPPKNFLSVGSLVEKKGHFDLINAFILATEERPDVSLTIIGDGPLRNDLQKLILDKDVRNKIKLLGAMKHYDVMDYYKNADAFILTSKTATNGDKEGIPTVLMEAQAFGLPVISTKHSGIPEVIPPENHKFLAEEGNIEQIKDCITKLIDNTDKDELRNVVERGRKKVEEEFNISIEVKKMIELYTAMID